MKKFIIGYLIFSVIIIVMLYFVTIIIETNQRLTYLREDLAIAAAENNDVEPFVKFQSIAYHQIGFEETDDYNVHYYQIIGSNNGEQLNQFSVFIIPKIEVDYATQSVDENDQTHMILKSSSNQDIIYQSTEDTNYEGYAVSYGLGEIGLYYYAIILNDDAAFDIELYDYQGALFFTDQIVYTAVTYDVENPGDFLPAYTQEEVEDLLDMPTYTLPALVENFTMFAIVDLVVFFIIYTFFKRKKNSL